MVGFQYDPTIQLIDPVGLLNQLKKAKIKLQISSKC